MGNAAPWVFDGQLRPPLVLNEDGRWDQRRKTMSLGFMEERVTWRERFQAKCFDFRGKSLFRRFDCCEFVKCTLLIDHGTEQLAFTECVFKDCNIEIN